MSRTVARFVPLLVGAGLLLGSVFAVGDARGESSDRSARQLAAQLFGDDGSDIDAQARDQLRAGLAAERNAVRDAVLRFLREERVVAAGGIEFGSRLHDALVVARTWRLTGAREELVRIVDVSLDPSTLPTGVSLHGGGIYPAAGALASIGGPPDLLVRSMTEKNHSVLLWVMSEAYGREATLGVLRGFDAARGPDPELLAKALTRLEAVERTPDLLPRWGK